MSFSPEFCPTPVSVVNESTLVEENQTFKALVTFDNKDSCTIQVVDHNQRLRTYQGEIEIFEAHLATVYDKQIFAGVEYQCLVSGAFFEDGSAEVFEVSSLYIEDIELTLDDTMASELEATVSSPDFDAFFSQEILEGAEFEYEVVV
jgi:hypothetical protein